MSTSSIFQYIIPIYLHSSTCSRYHPNPWKISPFSSGEKTLSIFSNIEYSTLSNSGAHSSIDGN